MEDQIRDAYGYVFEEELIQEIVQKGILKSGEPGDCLIDIGQEVKFMPLLLEGAIKILREDTEGDELLLYFLERGDSCAMTMKCCMGKAKSDIRAVAEKTCSLVMVPVENMSTWLSQYTGWRSFVFDSYHNRFKELIESIDSLAFLNMHDRLEKYLRDRALVNRNLILNVTHQEIANDLHSSRVVVSRVLKGLEREGKLQLDRNRIELFSL